MIPARHRRLLRLESRQKKTLTAAIIYLLLQGPKAPETPFLLRSRIPLFSRLLQQEILALHSAAEDQADEDTGDEEDPADPEELPEERALQVRKAARSLILAVSAFAALRKDQEFPEALEAAVDDAEARIARIAQTETFDAYNRRYIANTQDREGTWKWSAVLDKRTCPRCESLDGQEWTKAGDAPSAPLHILCRCVLEFIG